MRDALGALLRPGDACVYARATKSGSVRLSTCTVERFGKTDGPAPKVIVRWRRPRVGSGIVSPAHLVRVEAL